MGEFTGKIGTRGQQAGTILHEFGHNFGLGHGGTDEVNCKANYRSVMNYLFQFDLPDGGFISGRPLTYSSFALSAINELALREDIVSMTTQSNPTVIGGGYFTAPSTYTAYSPLYQNTNTRVDWNRDGVPPGTPSSSATSYVGDTNYFADISDCQVKNGPITLAQGANSGTATFTNSGAAGLDSVSELSGLTGAGLSSFTTGAVTITQTNSGATGSATFTNLGGSAAGLDSVSELSVLSGAGLSSVRDTPDILKSNLVGWNDLSNLVYNFRTGSSYDSGAIVINQVHTTTSTDGTISNQEFQTGLNVPGFGEATPLTGIEGTPGFGRSGVYTDPDYDNIVTSDINWGDGTTDPFTITRTNDGGTFSFGPHTYADNGSYTATITITAFRTDSGGNFFTYVTSISATVNIANANPVVNAGAPIAVTSPSKTVNINDASFTDLGILDALWNISTNWDDSTINTSTRAAQGTIPLATPAPTSTSHTYTYLFAQYELTKNFNVGITVTDKDGGFGSATKLITLSRLIVTTQLDAATASNGLKINDKGLTQVVIASQNGFDATKIATTSVKVRANTGLSSPSCPGASVQQSSNTKDLTGDGKLDMLIKVKTSELCLTLSTNQLITTGKINSPLTEFGSLVAAKIVN